MDSERLKIGKVVVAACTVVACGGGGTEPGTPAEPPAPAPPEAPEPVRVSRERSAPERPRAASTMHIEGDEPMPTEVSRAAFVPLVDSIRPGKKFWLGVAVYIAPGYRVSWRNPGDVGRRPDITVRAPAGFEVGNVKYPGPKRLSVPGGLVAYGYEGQTAFFVEVTPPRHLTIDDSYRFDLDADYAVCKKRCSSERINAFFELDVSWKGGRPTLDASTKPHFDALPAYLEDEPHAKQEWTIDDDRSVLTITAPNETFVDFFPWDEKKTKPSAVRPIDGGIELVFEGEPPRTPKNVRGVLHTRVAGNDRYLYVTAVWRFPDEDTD